ncbi:hypothetical protein IFM46972_01320 [Aspergillus udagawae]|uniref:Uncharacterized protein n=1 Tax=Aspergillus udagawae TaxID=91492 RepID=A0A8H3N4S6_9EURO|nr:hypothetical protein IFM46972_01320 [Aspergillus udagawae]
MSSEDTRLVTIGRDSRALGEMSFISRYLEASQQGKATSSEFFLFSSPPDSRTRGQNIEATMGIKKTSARDRRVAICLSIRRINTTARAPP